MFALARRQTPKRQSVFARECFPCFDHYQSTDNCRLLRRLPDQIEARPRRGRVELRVGVELRNGEFIYNC